MKSLESGAHLSWEGHVPPLRSGGGRHAHVLERRRFLVDASSTGDPTSPTHAASVLPNPSQPGGRSVPTVCRAAGPSRSLA